MGLWAKGICGRLHIADIPILYITVAWRARGLVLGRGALRGRRGRGSGRGACHAGWWRGWMRIIFEKMSEAGPETLDRGGEGLPQCRCWVEVLAEGCLRAVRWKPADLGFLG